jgi:hypothetical protein
MRALHLPRKLPPPRAAFVLVALSLLALAAVGAAGCSGGPTSDAARPDAGPLPESGLTDARPAPSESGLTDAPPSPDGGLADTGVPPSLNDSGPIAAAMNDVSILFPLPSSEADVDNLLSPSAAGDQGVLLPSALYSNAGPITGTTLVLDGGSSFSGFAAYDALRVVAMRIDPCFASLDPDPHGVGCTAQIRLVFQEVRWEPSGSDAGGPVAFDSALHVFYDLTRGEFLALAQALVDLRVANANGEAAGPLAPHPIMARQGLAGGMAKGVEQLILLYAGEKNLVRLAQLSTINNELTEIWQMSASDVGVVKTTATPSPIPTLGDGGVLSIGFGVGVPLPGQGDDAGPRTFSVGFDSTSATADDYTPLDDGTAENLSPSARETAFDALVRVENPRDNSPNTIDCGRCHLATPTEKLVALPLFSLDDTTGPLAFQPDGTSVTEADMTATFGTQFGLNIHAFSYFGTLPGINQRVVNETAAVVEYLNDLPK